ncbi:MAG: phosphodiesterase [Clostridia bacterium]|nr:phosphodiesterase [Clostridia bacterium]
MLILAASDIHGSAKYTEELIRAFEREGADRLLLLGDVLYHGPRNYLPSRYDPMEVVHLLTPFSEKTICVKGNCDAEIDELVLPFPVLPSIAILHPSGRMIFAEHGHRFEGSRPPVREGDIHLCGHTHMPEYKRVDNYIRCNPGSVSLPKGDTERGYILITDSALVWKTLDGEEYMRTAL